MRIGSGSFLRFLYRLVLTAVVHDDGRAIGQEGRRTYVVFQVVNGVVALVGSHFAIAQTHEVERRKWLVGLWVFRCAVASLFELKRTWLLP